MAKHDITTMKYLIKNKSTGEKRTIRGVERAAKLSGQPVEDLAVGSTYQGPHAKLGGGDSDTHYVKAVSHGRGKGVDFAFPPVKNG